MQLLILMLVSALAGTQAAKKQKVYSVDTLTVARVDATAQLTLHVAGSAPTGGWTELGLAQRIAIPEGPKDHVLRFDLVATNPTGIVPQKVTPFPSALDTTITPPKWATKIAVCARQGCKTRSVPRR